MSMKLKLTIIRIDWIVIVIGNVKKTMYCAYSNTHSRVFSLSLASQRVLGDFSNIYISQKLIVT